MTRLTSLLLPFFILTSCSNNDKASETYQKRHTLKGDSSKNVITTSNNDTTFKLDFFKAVPDTIDGCGEYFTYDTSKFAKDKYIFLSNMTDFAIIKMS